MGILKFSPNLLYGSAQSLQGCMLNFGNAAVGDGFPPIVDGYVTPLLPFLMAGNAGAFQTSTNCGLVRVMSGSRPTNIEALTSASPPPAGTTVLWELATFNVGVDWAPTLDNWVNNPTSISSIFSTVSATGIASWFWICTIAYGANGTQFPSLRYGTVVHNITGTIGLVGSGSDMEMLNTSLVSGQFLRLLNLKFQLPVEFE
jgi:hypothetical protein